MKERALQFYNENNPQRPDTEEILDFSLGVPQPSEVLENKSDDGYSATIIFLPFWPRCSAFC